MSLKIYSLVVNYLDLGMRLFIPVLADMASFWKMDSSPPPQQG